MRDSFPLKCGIRPARMRDSQFQGASSTPLFCGIQPPRFPQFGKGPLDGSQRHPGGCRKRCVVCRAGELSAFRQGADYREQGFSGVGNVRVGIQRLAVTIGNDQLSLLDGSGRVIKGTLPARLGPRYGADSRYCRFSEHATFPRGACQEVFSCRVAAFHDHLDAKVESPFVCGCLCAAWLSTNRIAQQNTHGPAFTILPLFPLLIHQDL